MEQEKHKIFVYGTLKSDGIRGLDKPIYDFYDSTKEIEKEFLGKAVTTDSKFSMVDLDAFPGVIINGYNDIYGEVYEGGDDLLEYCDMIEGHQSDKAKNFYHRDKVNTTEGPAYIYHLDPYYGDEYPDYKESDRIKFKNNILTWLN